MTSTELADVFNDTKEDLQDAGVTDEFFLDLLASRLLIERVGETNNLEWWDSRVLSKTGRARLSEVTPKTELQSRLNLALKVGTKAESDRIAEDALSLFDFGPRVESRLEAVIEEIETSDEITLDQLENLSIQSLGDGWTDAIIEQNASNISGSAENEIPDPDASGTLELNTRGYTVDEVEAEKWRLLAMFLRGYGSCTERLHVPYYPLESGIKSDNA
jgi:hypothetical protein